MARLRNKPVAEIEVEVPTIIKMLELTAKIAETQGMEAWEIVNAVNSALHFPLDIEFSADLKKANG